jgi:phage shock protein C
MWRREMWCQTLALDVACSSKQRPTLCGRKRMAGYRQTTVWERRSPQPGWPRRRQSSGGERGVVPWCHVEDAFQKPGTQRPAEEPFGGGLRGSTTRPTISLRTGRIDGLVGRLFGSNFGKNREVMQMETVRLARDPNDRWIGGVCGGIARWLGWNADMVRIIYVLASICSAAFPGTIVYIILWLVMPLEE